MNAPLLLAFSLAWSPLGEPGCGGAMTDVAFSPHDPKLALVCGDMLGIGRSSDAGESWGSTFGLKSYEVASSSFHPTDPKTVWVGTMGGPYLSKDGGKTWASCRAGMPEPSGYSYSAPVEQVLFDPKDPTHLIAVGGSSRRWEANTGSPAWGAIWESRDAGARWTKIAALEDKSVKMDNKGAGRNVVAAAFASPTRLYALVSESGLWRSDDRGKTWTRRGKGIVGRNVQRLQVHPKEANTLWVSTGPSREGDSGPFKPGGIWESRDGGLTFKSISNGLSQASADGYFQTAGYHGFAVSTKDPRFMVTGDGAWNTGVIYVTRDGGANWKAVATKGNVGQPNQGGKVPKVETAMPAGLAAGDMAISGETVLAISSEWIVKSADGGKTWTDASSRRVGDGWAGRGYTGWCTTQVLFDPYVKGRSMLQAMDAGRAWTSADGMKSWRYGDGFPYPWMGGMDAAWTKDGRAYGAYGQFNNFNGVGRSDDGGKTWSVVAGAAHGLPEIGAGGADPRAVYADPLKPDLVWVVLDGEMYASTDGARTFKKTVSGSRLNDLVGRGANVYASGDGGVSVSENGKPWRNLGGPKPSGRMALDRDGRLYVASPEGDRSGLWRYEGSAWTRLLDERYANDVAVDPKAPQRLIVTSGEDPYMDFNPAPGVWASSDGGASWSLQNAGLAMLRSGCAAFDPFSDAVVVGTYGRGFFRAAWPVGSPLAGAHRYASNAEDAEFAAPREASVPVLRNGSLTDALDPWSVGWVGRGKIEAARDTATFRSAPASLRATAVGDSQGQAQQMVEAPAGARFRLSGELKTAGRVKVNVAIQPFDKDWKPITFLQAAYAQNDSEWSAFEKVIELPVGTVRFGVILLVEGEGRAWLDDVKMTKP